MLEENRPPVSPAIEPFAIHAWQTGHDVEFYADDAALVDSVAQFLVEGAMAGQPIIVIATADRRDSFARALRSAGIDIDDLVEGRDRVWLDAEETLSSFMEGDRPNAELFEATVGNVFMRLKHNRDYVVARAYGEMVDVLWRSSRAAAALEIERLWNALGERHAFWLRCAYAGEALTADATGINARQICHHHRKTIVRHEDLRRFIPADIQALAG